MAQNIAIERVDHIGVRVRNLDRALGFYRVLGFAVVRRAVVARMCAISWRGSVRRSRTSISGARPT
jgi:catechol 2,3-dioxygenase-like lactoylglutathione lyase family enzyme